MKLNRQYPLLLLAGFLILGGLLYHSWQLHQSLEEHQAQWEQASAAQAKQDYLFARLLHQAGYGGFIHNFKNLVLRQDLKYLNAAENNRKELQTSLQEYAALALTPEERQALAQVSATFAEYFNHLDWLKAQGLAQADRRFLDRQVKVDDRAAKAALQKLAMANLHKSQQQQALTRANLAKNQDYKTWGLVTLGLSLLLTGILVYLLQRLYRAMSALQDSQDYLTSVINSVPDSMLIVDDTGKITQANQQAVAFFGYPLDRLLGMQVEELIPFNHRQHHHKLREGFQRHPQSRPMGIGMNLVALNAKGKEVPVEVSLGQIYHPHHSEVIATLHDISLRLQGEAELKASENRLKISQSIAQVGTWDWDIATGNLIWSEEIFHIFGLDRNQTHPNYELFLSCIPQADRHLVTDGVAEALQGTRSYDVVHPINHPSGKIKMLHEMGEVFRDGQGSPRRMVGVVHDVTLVKDTEAALVAAREQALAASQTKSEFLANISHEIRTPLNAVLGFTEVLSEEPLTPQQLQYLAAIDRAGKNLLRLINDILDLSKIEAEKIELLPTDSNPQDLFHEIQQIFDLKAKGKGLDFRCELPPGFPQALQWDEARVRQILLNLVGNAIKFTDQGQVLLTGQVLAKPIAGRVDLEFQIRDTGIGIPLDQTETIFGPFNQQRGQDHGKYGGTGLGLAISQRLVGLMGGRIWVEDNSPRGSVFHFTLPHLAVVTDKPEPREADPQQSFFFAPARLLLVDMHESNRRLMASYLVGSRLECHLAADSLEAVALCQREPFDLIVLDLTLPRLGGSEAATRIHAFGPNLGTPILAVTADLTLEEHAKALGEFALVLTKPFSKRNFLHALAQFLPCQVVDKETLPALAAPLPPPAEREQLRTWLLQLATPISTFGPASTINELETFASQVARQAHALPWPPLLDWSRQLALAAEEFNLQQGLNALEHYPALLKRIQEPL